jgi:hypothetical protein
MRREAARRRQHQLQLPSLRSPPHYQVSASLLRLLVSLHHFNADPDPAFHFYADPDPAFH